MDSLPTSLVSRPSTSQKTGFQEVNHNTMTGSAYNSSTTLRSNGKTSDVTTVYAGDINPEELSLMEKLSNHYHNRGNSGNKTKILARVWFQFQGITQLYMTMVYLVPYLLSDYSDMTQYYFKICVVYGFIMAEANWLCAICYSSKLPDMRDRSSMDYSWLEKRSDTPGQNGFDDATDKYGLKWYFCQHCNRYRPPRTRHCNFCGDCILRRDHHCYLIGNCIGHYNQRYFIVMCFYTILVSAFGFPMTVYYLYSLPGATWWAHYALPWTMLRFLCGEVSWQFMLLTFHSYMLMFFGVMGVIYFLGQLSIVAMGKTLFEVAKQVDMRVTTSTSENFRMVFGDYWLINFLFPAQIIFKQRHDGMNFEGVKIYYDHNEKK